MKRGYLPLYRKIQDHIFYKEKRVFSKYEAWIDILMEVRQSLEPEDVLIGMVVVVCKHGQSLNSLRTWGKRWGWSGKKVSRFFILLEKLKQIKTENVTVTTRITVLNYKVYDVKCHTDVTQGKQQGNSCDTEGKHDCPTDNNDNNVKNENNDNKTFKKPSIKEVEKYCLDKNFGKAVDPQEFINHYDAISWVVGKKKKPMENWKLSINTWNRNALKRDPSLKPKPVKETIVVCMDKTLWSNSDYQAGGLWKTSDITYTNFKPDFIDDDERKEVEASTKKFIDEYCNGGF